MYPLGELHNIVILYKVIRKGQKKMVQNFSTHFLVKNNATYLVGGLYILSCIICIYFIIESLYILISDFNINLQVKNKDKDIICDNYTIFKNIIKFADCSYDRFWSNKSWAYLD